MLSTSTWTRLQKRPKLTSRLRIWRNTWPMQRWKSSQEWVRRLVKCSRTCTWLIVSTQRTSAYQRSLQASPLQSDSLRPSSESLSLSQRCTYNQLSHHGTCRKLTDSLRSQHWTLLPPAWVTPVKTPHRNCKVSWRELKRLSREESQSVQESRIQNSNKSWTTGSKTREPFRWVSLRWLRGTSSSITKAEKSSKERDEKAQTTNSLYSTLH